MLDLQSPVTIPVIDHGRVRRLAGVVVGRTREESPRYDVMLPGGRIVTVDTGVAVPVEREEEAA